MESAAAPASPTVSLSPEDATAAEEILAAFDEYMAAYVELSKTGVAGRAEDTLARIENVPITGKIEHDFIFNFLNKNYQSGHATAGDLDWVAEVIAVDWEFSYPHNPDLVFPLATLRVCFDESNWTTVEVDTGEVVSGPRGRYLSIIKAEWTDAELSDGLVAEPGWYITSREDGTEQC